MFALILGTTGLSAALAYGWWSRVRVIWLRQDIFDLRDELYRVALAECAFEDPAYRVAREHLNAVANVADSITIPVMAYLLHRGVKDAKRPKSTNKKMEEAIQLAQAKCAGRIATFLLRQTFTGLVARPIIRLIYIGTVIEEQMQRWMERWVRSSVAEELNAPSLYPLLVRSKE